MKIFTITKRLNQAALRGLFFCPCRYNARNVMKFESFERSQWDF